MENTIDYLEGCRKAIANAQALVKSAELVKPNSYGHANSLLILAVEEAVKAGMLISRDFDPDALEKDFDKYFKDHRFKHKTIMAIEQLGKLMEAMSKTRENVFEKRYQEKGDLLSQEEINEAGDKGVEDVEQLLQSMLDAEGSDDQVWKEHGMDFNADWWKQANDNKKRGFYLGLNKGSRKWEVPSQITIKQYNESYSIVIDFVNRIAQAEEKSKEPWFQMLFNRFEYLVNSQKKKL